ncbi:hypothetical protein J6590_073023 [Homalodisca vitripennis]|nr:hypothetical protein J6590_073023 [Homalodisca vitripennis]
MAMKGPTPCCSLLLWMCPRVRRRCRENFTTQRPSFAFEVRPTRFVYNTWLPDSREQLILTHATIDPIFDLTSENYPFYCVNYGKTRFSTRYTEINKRLVNVKTYCTNTIDIEHHSNE